MGNMTAKNIEQQRILIVDDVMDNQLLLESILDDAGYRHIDTADSATEAFELLAMDESESSGTENYDLILMDIMMPDIDGIEATRNIKANDQLQDIPIIMVTAKGESEDLKTAFQAGAIDYITKPVDEIILLARVRSALMLKMEMDCRKEREAALTISLQQIHKDLEAAAQMQRSLLPKKSQILPGMHMAWHFKPCDAIGGDLFNVFSFDEYRLGFYLLDVSGHGVFAALYAVSIHRLLQDRHTAGGLLIDIEGQVRDPSDVVRQLNKQFLMDLDIGKYFTLTYGIYDSRTQRIRYTQAGHPPILCATNTQVNAWDDGDMPVGMLSDVDFSTHERLLTSGERLFFYSDGILEAENQDGVFLGDKRFSLSISEAAEMPLNECTTHIIQHVDAWLGESMAQDDITLLVLEVQ